VFCFCICFSVFAVVPLETIAIHALPPRQAALPRRVVQAVVLEVTHQAALAALPAMQAAQP